jgi:hypothetical protein
MPRGPVENRGELRGTRNRNAAHVTLIKSKFADSTFEPGGTRGVQRDSNRLASSSFIRRLEMNIFSAGCERVRDNCAEMIR